MADVDVDAAAKLEQAYARFTKITTGLKELQRQSKGRANCSNVSLDEIIGVVDSLAETIRWIDFAHAKIEGTIFHTAQTCNITLNVLILLLMEKGVFTKEDIQRKSKEYMADIKKKSDELQAKDQPPLQGPEAVANPFDVVSRET